MTYSNKLTAHYLALAKLPINEGNFAGDDVRYSSAYEVHENELGKATAVHETAAIDWQNTSLPIGSKPLADSAPSMTAFNWLPAVAATWAMSKSQA